MKLHACTCVGPGSARVAVIPIAALMVVVFASCGGDLKSPAAPDTRSSAFVIENVFTTSRFAVDGALAYQVFLTLRETAGVGATTSQVTATLADISGPATTAQLSATEAFGRTRITANGTLVSSGITVAGSLSKASDIMVQVTLVDDHGKAGSAETSTGVKAQFTGEWSGPTTITQPPGDWSTIRVSLIQSGDTLSGDFVTRDGRRFPVSGCVSCEGAPFVSVGGLPTGSSGCNIGLTFFEFAFWSGQMQRMSGRLGGRCPGTAVGTANLQRSA